MRRTTKILTIKDLFAILTTRRFCSSVRYGRTSRTPAPSRLCQKE
jgi:hypothetical protein